MKTNDGRLYVVAGKSRSGKTALVLKDIQRRKFRHVVAYDPDDQWGQLPGWKRCTTWAELLKALHEVIKNRHTGRGCKIAYFVQGDTDKLKTEFDALCNAVFRFAEAVGGCAFVAEELADVTSPGKAPGGWGCLLRRGLKRGISIYAISQRWAEADKTALGNVSEFLLLSMMPTDVKYMAEKSGIAAAELAALKVLKDERQTVCPYVKYDVDSGKIERGKMVFKK